MTGLCLLAGGAVTRLAVTAFTLAWVHSIEKIPLEDDWVVEPAGLLMVESRIKGSGAGIEPGEGARLQGGWLRWHPEAPPIPELVLRRSGYPGTGDWTLCTDGTCRPFSALLPPDADPVTLAPCRAVDDHQPVRPG